MGGCRAQNPWIVRRRCRCYHDDPPVPLTPWPPSSSCNIGAICVEFPAGLIDAGETPEGPAERELKEEGYGTCDGMSPTVVSNPGMSTGNMKLATVEVVLGEENSQPEQQLEEWTTL